MIRLIEGHLRLPIIEISSFLQAAAAAVYLRFTSVPKL